MRHLVQMGRTALRALALEWFVRGFVASGVGFNGETYDETKWPQMRSLLEAEFERMWSRRDKE